MKVALFLAILFVFLCSFLANGIERDQANEKEIVITPKADYDVKDRRKKYGTSSVDEAKLTKEDCTSTYGIRSFMEPAKTNLKIVYPADGNINEEITKPPILVISGGKYQTLIKNLVAGTVPGSTEKDHWVLWYSPYRLQRDSRKIYIIVHHLEAEKYKTHFVTEIGNNLEQHKKIRDSIRLVSCQINPDSVQDAKTFYGFGLNRYCGMALMAKKGVKNFWMADDNLLMVSKIADQLEPVEAKANEVGAAVVGFKSGKNGIVNEDGRDPKLEKMSEVIANPTTGPGEAAIVLEDRGENDFLEQLYYFRTEKLNQNLVSKFRSFSPMFLSSKEDMTFSYDLFLNDVPVKFVKDAEIFKVNMQFTVYDNTPGNKFVPDKSALITAIKASTTPMTYVKPTSWKFFGKDSDPIGKVAITTDEKFEDRKDPDVTQTENWVDTVSKTQEVVLYKCAVAAFKKKGQDVSTYFNPDPKFQFATGNVNFV